MSTLSRGRQAELLARGDSVSPRSGRGMTRQARGRPQQPLGEGKYARIERERRFLLAGLPPAVAVTARRRITDRYLPGTRLRLRRIDYPGSAGCEFKFTQKVPANRPGYVQGLITSTYLSAAEYDLLATLPATILSKTRLSVPPLSIDVFEVRSTAIKPPPGRRNGDRWKASEVRD